jgi:hypothetical protein
MKYNINLCNYLDSSNILFSIQYNNTNSAQKQWASLPKCHDSGFTVAKSAEIAKLPETVDPAAAASVPVAALTARKDMWPKC